jgi:integrase
LEFQGLIQSRKGLNSPTLRPASVQRYLVVLAYLYRYRAEIGDGLLVDPCQGQSAGAAAGGRRDNSYRYPYTPDAVAVPLIQGAIRLLTTCAADVLNARELYAAAISRAKRRGSAFEACNSAAHKVLRQVTIVTLRGPQKLDSVKDLAELIEMLYAACFVTISYLVGPRAAEILHLRFGCLRPVSAGGSVKSTSGGDTAFGVIVGAIFKQEVQYHGRRHEWVAPAPALHAISVLESLSAHHRSVSGRDQLWLRARGRYNGAKEWQHEQAGPFRLPTTEKMGISVRRFGKWLDLPNHEGKPWHLSTHQGRKTLARFVALRDRSSMHALAQHLGHRERAGTDQGYAGNDYLLDREIDAEILEQSVSAWEHMLASPGLGGRAGAEIIAKRPRFQGGRMDQGLKSYARQLVEVGLVLGVCEWGFCVYQQQYSACLGSTSGPNPVLREPSTCARCLNFAVSGQHRPYWVEQARRNEAFLNEPALPTQTLKIARQRLTEALAMIRSIDQSVTEDRNGKSPA